MTFYSRISINPLKNSHLKSQIPPSKIPQSQIPQSQIPQSQIPPSQIPQSQIPVSQIPPSQNIENFNTKCISSYVGNYSTTKDRTSNVKRNTDINPLSIQKHGDHMDGHLWKQLYFIIQIIQHQKRNKRH